MSTIPMPALHHVNLKTCRLQEMIDWYGVAVGMKPNHQFPGGAWLTNDAANHRVALLAVPGLEDDPEKLRHTGIHHMAFEYASVDELMDTYVRLKDDGHVPHACLDHGMTTSFYYCDPDDNSVELQYDNFGGDWAQSTAFLSTEAFAEDPIGKQIDPDQYLAAHRAGASAAELHERSYAGEFDPGTPLDLRLPVA